MVGADADDLRASSSRCCARFAENVFHVGGPGAGHIIKLLNNFIAQAICTATAEAFAVGQRAGIDLKQAGRRWCRSAPVNSGLFQMMAKTLDGDLGALRFELDNARKDIRYYTHLAEGLAIPTVVGEAVHQSLVLASALGHGKKFVPSLVEAQEQLTGAEHRPAPRLKRTAAEPAPRVRRASARAQPHRRAVGAGADQEAPRRCRCGGSSGSAACVAAIRSSVSANGSEGGRSISLRRAARLASNSPLPT